MEKSRYKLNLEIWSPGDGRMFLNYWDYQYGNDVNAQLIDGKIMLDNGDNPSTEISLTDFISRVEVAANA